MTEIVTWNLNLLIKDGPAIKLAGTLEPDAYDKVSVQIPENTQKKEVTVQPSGTGKIDFLCIISDQYPTDATKLTYKIVGGNKEIKLNCAHVLIGASLIDLLEAAPEKLEFKNKTENPANISILVGRKAV